MKLTKDECMRTIGWIGLGVIAIGLVRVPLGCVVHAQAASTTAIQRTVSLANGLSGTGTMEVTWPAFVTANSRAISAGREVLSIGTDGFVNLNLAQNTGVAQAILGQVRALVMSAAQVVQTEIKGQVNKATTRLTESHSTVTGRMQIAPLQLKDDQTQALQAADKHYLESALGLSVPFADASMTEALGNSFDFIGPMTSNFKGSTSNETGAVESGNSGTRAPTAAGGLKYQWALAAITSLPGNGQATPGIQITDNIAAATTKRLVNAAQYAGADCGARVNTADGTWIASSVEIDVNASCGTTWTTPITLSANHNLKFTQGGTYILPSGNVVKGNNDVGGIGPQVVLQLAAAQASAMFFTADGWHTTTGTNTASNVVFHDFTMDGNVTNNITTGCPNTVDTCAYGIYINSTPIQGPSNIEIKNIAFQNFHGPMVMVETGSNGIFGWPQASYVNIHNNTFTNEVWTMVKVYGFSAHMRIENNLFQNWDSLNLGYGLGIGWHSADSDDSDCTSSSPAATSDWKINNNRFLYPAQFYPKATNNHYFATEMYGGSYPCDYVNGIEYTHNFHDAGGLSGGTGFSGGGSNSHIDDNTWVNSTGYGTRNGIEGSFSNGSISRNIILNGSIGAYSIGRSFAANHFDLVDNIVQNYAPAGLSGMNALVVGKGTSSAPMSDVNVTGGIYDLSGQGTTSGSNNTSITVNSGTGYVANLKISGVKVLTCMSSGCNGIRIATATGSSSSGIEINNNWIQGGAGGSSSYGVFDGASGYPSGDTGVNVHDNKILNFTTPLSVYATGPSMAWGNALSATQTVPPNGSMVIQGNSVGANLSSGVVNFAPSKGALISMSGRTITISATAIGAVVASLPSALYTAPITCTAFPTPSAGWIGGVYQVSANITTTVPSSTVGTMQTHLGYYQIDGTYRDTTVGGVINLQTVGSDSRSIGYGIAQLSIRSQAGQPIKYCTSVLSGTPAGYTYSGVWYMEYLEF